MEEMFERIGKNKDKNVKFMVEASMMEIYSNRTKQQQQNSASSQHFDAPLSVYPCCVF